MPRLLDITGAMGPAVAQAGKSYREFGGELALERHQAEQLAISEENLKLNKEASRRAEEQLTMQQAEAARKDEEWETGNQLIDPRDYFSRLGIGQRTGAVLLEKGKRTGLMEPLHDGSFGVRMRNLDDVMKNITADKGAQIELELATLEDLQEQIGSIQELMQKKPDDPKLQEQLGMLMQKKVASLTNWARLKSDFSKKESTTSITEPKLHVMAQGTGPEAETAKQALADMEASKIRIAKERKEYTEAGLAQRKELLQYKSGLNVAAKKAGLKPMDQLMLEMMVVGPEGLSPEKRATWEKAKETDIKMATQLARVLGVNMTFQTAEPEEAVQMFLKAKKTVSERAEVETRKKQIATGKAKPKPATADVIRGLRDSAEIKAIKDPASKKARILELLKEQGYALSE